MYIREPSTGELGRGYEQDLKFRLLDANKFLPEFIFRQSATLACRDFRDVSWVCVRAGESYCASLSTIIYSTQKSETNLFSEANKLFSGTEISLLLAIAKGMLLRSSAELDVQLIHIN